MDNIDEGLRVVSQLKSRGVTRFYDLRQVNRRRIEDVEDDEQMDFPNGDLDDDTDDLGPPPSQRLRMSSPTASDAPALLPVINEEQALDPPVPPAFGLDAPGDDEFEYSPAYSPEVLPRDEVPQPLSPMPREVSTVEPNEEPPVPSPKSAAAAETSPPTSSTRPQLDPVTASLYQPAGPEDFSSRRLRVDRQETLSLFGPWRNRVQTAAPVEPYAPPPADNPEEAMFQSFPVLEMKGMELPNGWFVDEYGYFQLQDTAKDFWEVKAGCLIRHHVQPRRQRLCLDSLPADCPFSRDQLDPVRVTVVNERNGKTQSSTDDGQTLTPPCDRSWTGVTIFQISGPVRKEYAMYSHSSMKGAKQMAKDHKHSHMRKFKKENKGDLNERLMGPEDRAKFKEAKVKELRSFFENHVWEFQTTAEADPARTMTSRMILKWSKNPDGSPRAKARLIVRGYTDPDALEGKVVTSSPTTSRQSRTMLMSLSATLRWDMWTSDISTAFLQGKAQDRKLWVKLVGEGCALLGCDENTRMLLLKPCYGQLDAPRGWYLEAVDRLRSKKLRQHHLDPCCFLIYEQDFDASGSWKEECREANPGVLGEHGLCGMIVLHVDDMLGAGCGQSECYKKVIAELQTVFSFREWKDGRNLEYCGANIDLITDHTWKFHHADFFRKVKPITYDKKRDMGEMLSEKEVTQVRGLLGSLQWPAVQSSPHLQCSTSILSGQISQATVRTMHECNRLLKFAKENVDVGLMYQPLCAPEDLRLVCFFDAAFATRTDGSSQGGYLIMRVSRTVLDGTEEEGAYHILDWKSFKTPRVARSSLGAEAQGGGQAVDSVDYVCRYWEHLLHPDLSLGQLLELSSSLLPVMVTDAKALYDSYHREGAGGSLVDKRVSLEIRVVRDRLQQLQGVLRWMSSERQLADGLTKESARQLLAERLRHAKLKLTWDPNYVAAKKKTKEERQKSIGETTKRNPKKKQIHEEDDLVDTTEMTLPENAMFVRTLDVVEYTFAASHVAFRRENDIKGRMQYFMKFVCCILFWTQLQAASAVDVDQCPLEENSEANGESLQWFLWFQVAILLLAFLLGRFCRFEKKRQFQDAEVQKDLTLVEARIRDAWKEERKIAREYQLAAENAQRQTQEYKRTAQEARNAMRLMQGDWEEKLHQIESGRSLVLKMQREMELHASECAHRTGVLFSKKSSRCWHQPDGCETLDRTADEDKVHLRACSVCNPRVPPPRREDHFFGGTLEDEIEQWLSEIRQ